MNNSHPLIKIDCDLGNDWLGVYRLRLHLWTGDCVTFYCWRFLKFTVALRLPAVLVNAIDEPPNLEDKNGEARTD